VAAVGIIFALLVGCGDSSVGPFASSPVGRYELVGCTYGGDTTAGNFESVCSTGGSNHYNWSSGSVELNDDGTATRTLVVSNTHIGSPMPGPFIDTSTFVGSWTAASRDVNTTWVGLPYVATTVFTRVEGDMLRDNSVWNDSIYFWYRRSP